MSKRARVVIGANFGDEGKGLVVDHLCATQGAGMVVRFNGGAQAGHTVVADGRRHVFSHIGAGALWGAPTFLSQFFVVNPIMLFRELFALQSIGCVPTVYAHPDCLVTTFADMIINQAKETARGSGRHGSCGIGFHETITRSSMPHLQITMSDLWNGVDLRPRLAEICDKYARFRTGTPIAKAEEMIEAFSKGCSEVANFLNPLGIAQCPAPIFEGAQGLLLDQSNKEFAPHVTHSNTGMKNVRVLMDQAGIDEAEVWYVTRTYATRHGAGPLPGEMPDLSFEDDTNLENEFQGRLRFGLLDATKLLRRCHDDSGGSFKLAVTHADQFSPAFAIGESADLLSHGPSRDDVEVVKERAFPA